MRALLINPEFPNTYWSFQHALSFEGKRSAFPPLSLLTVSALLPNSWERRLIDLNVRRLKPSDIDWADIVMVTAMLVQKESLHRVVELCKARGKRVAVGGPYVTTSLDSLPLADHIFLGEAETTLPQFARDFERGEARRFYQSNKRPPLSSVPVPHFHIADLKRYSAMSIQYSRGCPFQCEFCDIIEIYGRTPRTKSNEQMMMELDSLHRTGWRGSVFIVDDNFIGNKPSVKRLLPELSEWQEKRRRPFTFLTEASVNLAEDDELLCGMQRAGFRRVFLGIETPVEESLKEANKRQNTRGDLLASVKKIQSFGMEVMGGFIVGFDSDPEDIFERQIDFIRESAIPLAMVGLLNALPDTQLWRRLKREGRLLAESNGNNTDGRLNFVPRMNSTRLIEGYQSLMRAIYSPGQYYERALECLGRVASDEPSPNHRSVAASIAAFTRIVLKLGIVDRERGEFWRFMRRAFIEHRDKFAEAARLAAMGYHFRRLTVDNMTA
ncbi:MAG: B12-binding domain-containing radical SAM protein [Acidobacteriota bacterium]